MSFSIRRTRVVFKHLLAYPPWNAALHKSANQPCCATTRTTSIMKLNSVNIVAVGIASHAENAR